MNRYWSKNPALVILSLGGIALAIYVLLGPFSPHVLNQSETTENVRKIMSHFRVKGTDREEKFKQARVSLVISTTQEFIMNSKEEVG